MEKYCTGCGASYSETISSKKPCCPDGRFRTFTELAASEAMLQRKLIAIEFGMRCTSCGGFEGIKACCSNPKYLTWMQLVEIERLTFTRLLKVELRLQERYASQEDIKKTLDEVSRFKQPELFQEL